MKTRAIVTILVLLAFGATTAVAQTNVTVDPLAINLGYMNVFELDGTTFAFGQPWGFADLTAVYNGNDLTLGACPIGTDDAFWYIDFGTPGRVGNKIMEANAYAEPNPSLPGQVVTFSGEVVSNTLTDAHTVVAFVKDYAPDFSSFVASTVVLSSPGMFSVSLETINDPARHVQWGFQTIGVNVWPELVGQYGAMVIGQDPAVPTETTTWGDVKSLFR